ncbi:MAG: glycoside hydrolase family 43 protein [Promicromonosporaceae bacterium]|nr:glycoside hydrolase family 43 protein [Promicromonosporaceae bacterium]
MSFTPKNPTLLGFHPDPSTVKVGEDYYCVTSSFEFHPGLPVYHSRDLRDWTLIGHVLTRGGQVADAARTLGGPWAPTIRHHDGLFYVAFADVGGRGMLLFTAEDAAGPWSDGLEIDVNGIDPDLAWDEDGACYLTFSALRLFGPERGRHDGIVQVRLDHHTGEVLTAERRLWSGTGGCFPEMPHLYRERGWWYLLIAEGGTERGHAVSIARSRTPDGGFEGCPANPILSHRGTDLPVQNVGHGDLVPAPGGDGWAFVMLGMRTKGGNRAFSPLGRETFTTRVVWDGDWPVMEPVHLSEPESDSWTVPFGLQTLGEQWVGMRALPAHLIAGAALPARPGGGSLDDPLCALVGFRQPHQTIRFSAQVDASRGVGGVVVRLDEQHHYSVELGHRVVTARGRVATIEQAWTAEVPAGPITLWIETAPPADGPGGLRWIAPDFLRLGFDGPDGPVTLAELDGRYLSAEPTASFTGRLLGLFCTSGLITVGAVAYRGSNA